MQKGDLVRLKRPFIPEPTSGKQYTLGIVVDLVWDESKETPGQGLTEVLLYLYDGDRQEPYVDEFGVNPLYSFYPSELDDLIQ